MKGNPRAGLLIAAALLMFFSAFANAMVMVPDLHGDLVELGVRPTVLNGSVRALHFAAASMFIFALMAAEAAIQSMRGKGIARLPLAAIALLHTVFGVTAFARSQNPHHIGGIAIGVLIAAALIVRPSNPGGHP